MTMLKKVFAVLGIFAFVFVVAIFAIAGYGRHVGLFLVGVFMFLVLSCWRGSRTQLRL